MNNKKSFVEQLTQEDITNILSLIGLELDEDRIRFDEKGHEQGAIIRGKDDDGQNHIIAFCNDRQEQEMESEIAKYMYEKSPAFRDLMNKITTVSMSFPGFGGMSQYMANGKVILNIEDFMITESLSLKSEQDEIEYDRMMTEIYQIYMVEKFGSEYTKKKDEYVKSLKEAQKEDDGQQMQ